MPPRILIADDNPNVRTALRQLLEQEQPLEFFQAENGEEALAKALEFHVDVVILDLAMPVMDGLTAARKILQQRPQTVIFLCTMHASKALEKEAMTAGIRSVFSKARSHDLIAAVRQALIAKPDPPRPESLSPTQKTKGKPPAEPASS